MWKCGRVALGQGRRDKVLGLIQVWIWSRDYFCFTYWTAFMHSSLFSSFPLLVSFCYLVSF